MLELIHVTPEYALAVLLTVLPFVSDFSAKLGVPVQTPVTTNDVARFVCNRFKGEIGGYITLKDGSQFWFDHGYVKGYRTPKSYYHVQDPKDVPKFYGKVNLTEEEAIKRAREAILKLGYGLKETFTDQEPEVDLPPQDGTNTVSYYRFRWIDPLDATPSVEIGMSGIDGTIHSMMFFSTLYWREPPRVPGISRPDLLQAERPEISDTNHLLGEILKQGSVLAKTAGLPIALPLNDKMADRFVNIGLPDHAEVKLTNGYWFYFEEGYLRGFSAPDSYYKRHLDEKRPPLEPFLGQWNMNTNEALALARATIRKVSPALHEVRLDDPPEEMNKPKPVGKYVIPRCSFRWTIRDKRNRSFALVNVEIEIDASTKAVKYLYIWDGYLRKNSENTTESRTNSVKEK